MRLKNISVKRLFGTYTYSIPLWENEAVTILHSPNGHGKTTILKLVEAVMEGNLLYLDEIPFSNFTLQFENEITISVYKKDVFSSYLEKDFFTFRKLAMHGTEEQMMLPFVYEIKDVQGGVTTYPVPLDREVILSLSRKMAMGRSRLVADVQPEPLSLRELIVEEALEEEIFKTSELFMKLLQYKGKCNIHIIESNRVFKQVSVGEEPVLVERVRLYAQELGQMIAAVRQHASDVADGLDQTFPARVLKNIFDEKKSDVFTQTEIYIQLKKLEERRNALVEAGILPVQDTTFMESFQYAKEQILSEDTRCFLTVYIKDNWKKLDCYTGLKEKLDILLEIINIKNGFSNKKMRIQGQVGAIFQMNNGKTIPLEKLSSGEKNDFVLFYELIFKCDKNSLIFIDEPEISLHIAWQQEFIRQLLHICYVNQMQAVVATHSPNIVDEYWNLLVDLEGEGEV